MIPATLSASISEFGAIAAGRVAGLLVDDDNAALDPHGGQAFAGKGACGLFVRSRPEQEDVVRVADLRAGGRRGGAPEGDAGFFGPLGDVDVSRILGELA